MSEQKVAVQRPDAGGCGRTRHHILLRLRTRASSPCGPGRRFPGASGRGSRGAPPRGPGPASRSDKGEGAGAGDGSVTAPGGRPERRRTRRRGLQRPGPRTRCSQARAEGWRRGGARAGREAPCRELPRSAPSGPGTPVALVPGHLAGLGRSVVPRAARATPPRRPPAGRPHPAAAQRPSVPSGGRGGGVCSHPRDHMVTLGSQCSGR